MAGISTNVPPCTLGPNGFIAPPESAILAGRQADFQAAFGGTLNFTTQSGAQTNPTSQGQLCASDAAILGAVNDIFLLFTNLINPAFSSGRFQDGIGALYSIKRIASQPTVLQISCIGLAGVPIPVGASTQDGAGNIYTCTAAGVIGSGGSVALPFANNAQGPITIPSTVTPYQAIPGWDSATVLSGVLGNNTETASEFELRRQQSVAQNSLGMIQSIKGAVLALPGVIDCYAWQNDTGGPVTIQGLTIPVSCVYVAVVGGESAQIAQAIWLKKSQGSPYYPGNTTVTVLDTDGYVAPYPAYSVVYEVPAGLNVLVQVNIVNSAAVPSNAQTLIQNAVIAAFAGQDNAPRAGRIAGQLLASRISAAITVPANGGVVNPYYLPWAQIVSVLIGSPNAPAASFTGSTSGTTLTVSAVASGTLADGQALFDATGNIIPGTTILAQLTGSTGGTGTYTVSNAQTVGSEPMTGVTASLYAITPNLNQIPGTLAAYVLPIGLI